MSLDPLQYFTADQNCPVCRKYGHWRSGQEFDHMKRCPDCSIVWIPESMYNFEIFNKKYELSLTPESVARPPVRKSARARPEFTYTPPLQTVVEQMKAESNREIDPKALEEVITSGKGSNDRKPTDDLPMITLRIENKPTRPPNIMSKLPIEYPEIVKGISFMTALKVSRGRDIMVRHVALESNDKFSVALLNSVTDPRFFISTPALFDTPEEGKEYLDKLVEGCIRYVDDTRRRDNEPKGTVCQECNAWVKKGVELYLPDPGLTRTHLPTCSQFPVEWAMPMLRHYYQKRRESQARYMELTDIHDRMHRHHRMAYENVCHENNVLRQRLYPGK